MTPDTTLPCRLGATSYVIEGDLVANARRLRGLVADMQILLWRTAAGENNIPTPDEVQQLVEVAGGALTFSLHLPLFIRLTALTHDERQRSLDEAAALLHLCAPLKLSVVVAHLEGGEPEAEDEAGWLAWAERAEAALSALNQLALCPICVENTERYPIERALPTLARLNQPLCLDIGHHLKMGEPAATSIRERLHRARAIHLHGWDGQQDHLPLSERTMPPTLLATLLETIRAQAWDGVLTLELFGEGDFFPSLAYLLRHARGLMP